MVHWSIIVQGGPIGQLKVHLEYLGEVDAFLGIGIEVMTAFILGGLIGYDREKKMKSAGIKTNILICIGATLYTTISLLNYQLFSGGPSDPNRMAAQVVSGIGFLGAGAIMRGSEGVTGLTTAATIWVVAAIGVTIGSGYPIIATMFTLTTLAVLKLLNPIYKLIEMGESDRFYRVEILSRGGVRSLVEPILLKEVSELKEVGEEILDVSIDQRLLTLGLYVNTRKIHELTNELKYIIQVEKVKYYEAFEIKPTEDG